jgi:hypothetical protein
MKKNKVHLIIASSIYLTIGIIFFVTGLICSIVVPNFLSITSTVAPSTLPIIMMILGLGLIALGFKNLYNFLADKVIEKKDNKQKP